MVNKHTKFQIKMTLYSFAILYRVAAALGEQITLLFFKTGKTGNLRDNALNYVIPPVSNVFRLLLRVD